MADPIPSGVAPAEEDRSLVSMFIQKSEKWALLTSSTSPDEWDLMNIFTRTPPGEE